MAVPHAHSHQPFFRPPSQLSLDRKPSTASLNSANFFDDLDDSLPESSMLSPSVTPTSLMSPQMSTVWDDFASGPFSHPQERTDSVSTNPFAQTNNPFLRLEPAQAAMYGQQSVPWTPFDRPEPSTAPTPVPKFEPFGDVDPPQHHRPSHPHVFPVPADFGSVPMQPQPSQPLANVRPGAVFPTATPLAQSPTVEKQWMALPSSSAPHVHAAPAVEERPAPKRMRPNSPQRASTYATFTRGDGIRKKNARLEIPVERNLTNIDRLIQESTNEEEKKELKAQKRLLRNRQAALDSRQRKKKHTEDLEKEQKIWTERIQSLEAELGALRIQSSELLAEKDQWMRERCALAQQIETAQWEKEELVRSHTLETGDLRKKVNFLREQLDATAGGMGSVGEHPPSMATPHNVGAFNEFTSEMDNLNMASEWDSYIYDFCVDPDTPTTPTANATVVSVSSSATPTPPHSSLDASSSSSTSSSEPNPNATTTLVVSRSKLPPSKSDDKPVNHGILLMLLLWGAFVARHSGGPTAPSLPPLPDDVRAASGAVLDSILNDEQPGTDFVGAVHPSSSSAPALPVMTINPASTWPKPTAPGGLTDHIMGDAAPPAAASAMDRLHAALTQPSKAQEAEQLFSLTPTQYSALTDPGHGMSAAEEEDEKGAGARRRNLAEALAAMRERRGESAAEVYTRSLLWEQIPGEVVREFKRMVEEERKKEAGEAMGG